MKKIPVNKTDDAAAIVEKFLREPDPNIVLVIPRGAKIKESPRSFNLLKREAEAAGRHVSVESVDEEILALAEASGLYNEHPLFHGGKSMSDILPSGAYPEEAVPSRKHKVTLNVRMSEGEEEKKSSAENRFFQSLNETISAVKDQGDVSEEDSNSWQDEEENTPPGRPRRIFKKTLFSLAVLLVLIGGYWLAGTYFSRAEVKIHFNQIPWEFSGSIAASKNAAKIDLVSKTIPAEVFGDKRNLTQLFPASGKAVVQQKATGKIRIYNAYSSERQTLVATTRFQTSDGKIFRLDSQVLVPGAQIVNGRITPSSVEAYITADKTGPEYNIGPIDKLVIPGFKSTPKFQGFYGSIEGTTSGGYNGERAVPTDADISTAQARMTDILKSSLENNLVSGQAKDYKILGGASSVSVTHLTVKKETDDKGQFSVFGEAQSQAVGFREEDLKSLLDNLASIDFAKNNISNTSFRSLSLQYDQPQVNYVQGQIRFNLAAKGTRATDFSSDQLKKDLMGKIASVGQGVIMRLPGLAEANLYLYPRWFFFHQQIPTNPARINITSD